jgi:hypothetical protein
MAGLGHNSSSSNNNNNSSAAGMAMEAGNMQAHNNLMVKFESPSLHTPPLSLE